MLRRSTLPAPRPQSGFTLIELMIGMTVGLIMVAGIVTLVSSVSRGNRNLSDATRMIDNGRYTASYLREELRHAGFYSHLYPAAATGWPALPAILPDPCANLTSAGLVANLPLFIQGEDRPTGKPSNSCLTDASHVDGTDIFFVRRARTSVTPLTAANADSFYLQASSSSYRLDRGSEVDKSTGFGISRQDSAGNLVPAELRHLHVDGYYISPRTRPVGVTPCDGREGAGQASPTLTRLTLSGNSFCAEPVASGIEDMQIEYGIDDDGNGIPERYVESPASTADWGNVVAVQLFILARGEGGANNVGGKTFLLGEGTPGPDGTDSYAADDDGRPRHVFAHAVRLLNISGRRERP